MESKQGTLPALLTALVFVLVVGACTSTDEPPPVPPAASAAASTAAQPTTVPTPTPAAAAAAPTAPAAPAGETITVTKVIDGDTFELADGRRIRVLGIDSCEMSTYGGKEAKAAAEGQLSNSYNNPIVMTAQPGVDVDRYGRLLRYVTLGGNAHDFGEFMVKYDHTGVYQGKPNDASPEYLQKLYAADLEYALNPPAGRNCDNPYPPAPAGGSSDSDSGGSSNGRDGSSTGGYCARKWWC